MSYTIDVYRGKVKSEQSLICFCTYIAFFPQLVAGPIVRASDFLPQLKKDQLFLAKDFLFGICFITWGFVLKSVLADSLSMVVDGRFNNPTAFNQWNHFIGVLFYGFQIYGDFAGYSLIAIGVARLMGFRFNQNFDSPYFSSSFSQFWRKWHISLSNWLRDYIYISFGGNRKGTLKMYRNLMVTMILGGLWHGASFNFVI